MNLSVVSSIKFSGENVQSQINLPQQKQPAVNGNRTEQKYSSKFLGADKLQLVKDKFEKLTPEKINNLFIASGLTSILSGTLSYIGDKSKFVKAVSSVFSAVGFIGFAVASVRTIMNAQNKKPVQESLKQEVQSSAINIDPSVKTDEITEKTEEQPKGLEQDEKTNEELQSVVVNDKEQETGEGSTQQSVVPSSSVSNALFVDFQK